MNEYGLILPRGPWIGKPVRNVSVKVYCPENGPDDHKIITQAFCAGLKTLGFDAGMRTLEEGYVQADVTAVFGVYKRQVAQSIPRGRVIRDAQANGSDVIILERGYVKRDEFWSAGWNGLNGRAYVPAPLYAGRAAEKIGDYSRAWDAVACDSLRNGNANIVLCGQVPWDATVQDYNHVLWLTWVMSTLLEANQNYGDHKIHFRPHPAVTNPKDVYGSIMQFVDTAMELDDYDMVVTFNSSTASAQAWKGRPVTALDRGSVAYGIANQDIIHALCPPVFTNHHRAQWALELAHRQWSVEEYKDGTAAMQLFYPFVEEGTTWMKI